MSSKIETDAAISDESLDGVVGGNMWLSLFGWGHAPTPQGANGLNYHRDVAKGIMDMMRGMGGFSK